MEIKVAIIEDNPEIRDNLELLLSSDGFVCLKAFENAEDAIREMPDLNPDVAIVDVHLPKLSGIECITALKAICLSTQFLIFTIFEDDDTVFNALKAGATGYLLKNTPPDKLLSSIVEIYQGGSPMTGKIARKIIQSFSASQSSGSELSQLTQRENEILLHLSKGYRYKEIAVKLFISTETVRTHIRNIYEKLQVESRTEALNKYYNRNGSM